MEDSIWRVECHDHRDLNEVTESGFKCSGDLFADLSEMASSLGAFVHPEFKKTTPQSDQELPSFCSNSVKFDKFSFKILCSVLKNNPTQKVKFQNCELTDEHLEMLLEVTRADTLTSLQLDWNPFLGSQKCPELCNDLSRLRFLSLRCCGINDEALELICKNLKSNKSIKTLNLYGNNFSSLENIAEVLKENRVLVSLNLSKNNLTDSHLEPLIGQFGKVALDPSKVEECKKKLKDSAKSKPSKSKAQLEIDLPQDELVQEEETYYLICNKSFKNLVLDLNCITGGDNLEQLVQQLLPESKVFVAMNQIEEPTKKTLANKYPSSLVL